MIDFLSLSTAVPEHCVTAAETKSFLARLLPADLASRFDRLVDGSGNSSRFGVVPLEELATLQTLEARNRAYARYAVPLAESAARRAIDRARVAPESVTALICASSTGYVMPTLDAYLMNRLGLRPSCRRVPLTQMGCGGGLSALALAAQLLRGGEGGNALIVTVELPSLCLQLAEPSVNDLLAATQFGDGAAAAVLSSWDGSGPEVVATRSVLLSDTVELDGILLTSTGLRPVPRRGFPRLVRNHVPAAVAGFLRTHDLEREQVSFTAVHGRSPQVMHAMKESLQLSERDLVAPRRVWERYGNMLSSTVFFVLDELRQTDPPAQGAAGLMLAFGAGVSCEMVLLRAGGWLSAEV